MNNIIPLTRIFAASRITHEPQDSFARHLARTDLHQLSLPPGISDACELPLYSENILLPVEGHPRFRYGSCAYLLTKDGRQALPVVGCRAWFQPPLPAEPGTHPVWSDLLGGLLEASNRISTSTLDLNCAMATARSWMNSHHASSPANRGSVVLLGRGEHIFCDGQPDLDPPQTTQTASIITYPAQPKPLKKAA